MIINPILVKLGGMPTYSSLVRWFDYDGTLLKSQIVKTGNNATPPDDPVQANLTFQGWNISHLNVQTDLDIGATYITTDGKTHVHIRLTTVTTLNVPLYLNKSDSSTLTVDWGDGSAVSTFTNSGNFNTGIKTYASAGDYVIKMWISSGVGTYSFGNQNTSIYFIGGSSGQTSCLIKLHIGENVIALPLGSFVGHGSLIHVSIPYGVTDIGESAFNGCMSLVSLIVPNSVNSIGTLACRFTVGLKIVSIPNSVVSIGATAFGYYLQIEKFIIPNTVTAIAVDTFYFCYLVLKTIIAPSSVTSIGTNAFHSCWSMLEYVFLSTTPPTLASTNAFTGIPSLCKIYVPDDSVAAYKSATNWSIYANYIYPLSTK